LTLLTLLTFGYPTHSCPTCRSRLWNLRADCSTADLYCEQIVLLLQVVLLSRLFCWSLLRTHCSTVDLYENTRNCFSKDAENLTMYGYVLW